MDDGANPETALSDPLATMLGFQLRKASVAAMNALAAELEPTGIRPSEASLLILIGANPGLTQSDLARALRASPANLVPLLARLSQTRALERTRGKGRAIGLSLSSEGQKLYAQVRAAFARHEARITRSVPAGRHEEILALLQQVVIDACCRDHD